MPLFELFRHNKSAQDNNNNNNSSLSLDDEVVELVWENGQISTQSQSTRTRNIPPPPQQASSSRLREIGNTSKITTMDEIPMSVPSLMTGLTQDDDFVPWLNHHHDYSSDFFNQETDLPENQTPGEPSSSHYTGFQSHNQQTKPDRFTQREEPSSKPDVINFSHFLRPAALSKTNKNIQSAPNVLQTRVIGGKECEEEDKDVTESVIMPKDKQKVEDLSRKEQESEKAVVCSSVGSGNSPSESPSLSLKRKCLDTQDTECHSEDVEEESGDGRKETVPSRTGHGSKRSRSAEVHNLSERRRRDRINEKMRALQELIPNCNKVDKASMLDEAIEYLKSLQLQVQIMSMASGYYMPPVMFPPPMGHYPAAAAAAMAMGMGMPYGIGLPNHVQPQFQLSGMQQQQQQPVAMGIPRVSGGGFFAGSSSMEMNKSDDGSTRDLSGSKDRTTTNGDSGLRPVKRKQESSDQLCGSS